MSADERATHLGEIQTAVKRMTKMMEDLLLHGKFESGRIECKPAPVNIPTLCRRLIAEAGDAQQARRIECLIDPAAEQVVLDENILQHILGNLLSNAVKYSAADQPVTLELIRAVDTLQLNGDQTLLASEHLRIKVRDSGIGIPAAALSRMFETFHRAANVGNRPGTGMGLAIVKQFVDLHRGTIRIESEEGRGTTVWVCVPIASEDLADGVPRPFHSTKTAEALLTL